MTNSEAFGYFCLGTAVGVTAAVLFAPKSGEETRGFLTSQAQTGADYVKARAEDIRSATNDKLDTVKSAVKKQSDSLAAGVDAGMKAYRDSFDRETVS